MSSYLDTLINKGKDKFSQAAQKSVSVLTKPLGKLKEIEAEITKQASSVKIPSLNDFGFMKRKNELSKKADEFENVTIRGSAQATFRNSSNFSQPEYPVHGAYVMRKPQKVEDKQKHNLLQDNIPPDIQAKFMGDKNQPYVHSVFNRRQAFSFIISIHKSISYASKIPPLQLYVNPRYFRKHMEKVLNESYARNRYQREYQHENLDKIETGGILGGFYTKETGLTTEFRKNSGAFQQTMLLYLFYKSNGALYKTQFLKQQIVEPGLITIRYANMLYHGVFENFVLTDSADTPYSIEYSFTFNVQQWEDLEMNTNQTKQEVDEKTQLYSGPPKLPSDIGQGGDRPGDQVA